MWRLGGLTLFALLCTVVSLGAWTSAHPPPIEVDDDEAHEVETSVTPSAKAVTYTVRFAHLPSTVTAEDFLARVIANKVLKISALGAPIDWHFRLAEVCCHCCPKNNAVKTRYKREQAIPPGYKFIPAVEVERHPGDHTGAVWRTSVVMPKTLQRFPVSVPVSKREEAAPQPSRTQGAPQGGFRGRPTYGWWSTPQRQPARLPWALPIGQEPTATVTTPRHAERPLSSASVLESMPLPSFDN